MAFSMQVVVNVPRPHGVGAIVIAGATEENVLDVAASYACYYTHEAAYAFVEVELSIACPVCKGTGRALKKRTKRTYIDCTAPSCEAGWVLFAKSARIPAAEVAQPRLLAVRLDDGKFGGGPGTVVAIVESADAYNAMVTDLIGARDPRMRLWQGVAAVGDRVATRDEGGTRYVP